MDGYDAVVLAGGGARRLGGQDKATLVIGSRSLLQRAVSAVDTASRVVVVGPERATAPGVRDTPVVFVCEDPPGGGPVAALAAAIDAIDEAEVVVLACDMPFVDAATVRRLRQARGTTTDGALLVDADGRRQPLCAVYDVPALGSALEAVGRPAGISMRELVSHLTLTEIAADPREALDCDTWDDVARSREFLEDS